MEREAQDHGFACKARRGRAMMARMSSRERPFASSSALDDVSKSIIEQLQQDGRRSYATIAGAVGLSAAAVRQRVQRLLKAGVIQIVAVTDPLQLGFPRQAMIGIRIEGDIEAVADQLEKFPEVDYVVVTAGSFDLRGRRPSARASERTYPGHPGCS